MPNEPERPIEKLLRACARKRREAGREAAGFELHPATRRLLQGEVARRFQRQQQARVRDTRRWAAAFWPRLVEACVLVTLMAVVASLLLPAWRHSGPEKHLAKSDAVALQSAPAPAAASPSPANEPAKQLEARQRLNAPEVAAAEKDVLVGQRTSNQSAPDRKMAFGLSGGTTSAGAQAPAPALAQNPLRRQSAAPSAPPKANEPLTLTDNTAGRAEPRPDESKTTLAFGDAGRMNLASNATDRDEAGVTTLEGLSSVTNGVWGFTATNVLAEAGTAFALKQDNPGSEAERPFMFQNYTQVLPQSQIRAKLETKAGLPVLASFQVQQAGRELRVIDSDGSVYTGSVLSGDSSKRMLLSDGLASPKAAENAPLSTRSGFAKAKAAPVPSPMQFFRVAGTNRSLNQTVVFSGNWSGQTNPAVGGKLQGYVLSGGGGGPAPAGLLLNSRIWGEAVVGTNQVIPIEAVPGP